MNAHSCVYEASVEKKLGLFRLVRPCENLSVLERERYEHVAGEISVAAAHCRVFLDST